jgi:hypothetical protein
MSLSESSTYLAVVDVYNIITVIHFDTDQKIKKNILGRPEDEIIDLYFKVKIENSLRKKGV